MPYLNWKEHAHLGQEVGPADEAHRGARQELHHMTLSLPPESIAELVPLLREAFSDSGSELRLELPRGWILFWKRREGESRLLLAHPQPDEWVATLALSSGHGAALVERLESQLAASAGSQLSVGELAQTGGVSNLELTLVHRPIGPAGQPGG